MTPKIYFFHSPFFCVLAASELCKKKTPGRVAQHSLSNLYKIIYVPVIYINVRQSAHSAKKGRNYLTNFNQTKTKAISNIVV